MPRILPIIVTTEKSLAFRLKLDLKCSLEQSGPVRLALMAVITPVIKHDNPDVGARRAVPRLGEASLAPIIDMFNCPRKCPAGALLTPVGTAPCTSTLLR